MLAADSASGWAQVGFVWKSFPQNNRFFIQEELLSGTYDPTTIYWGSPNSNQTYEFTVNRADDTHNVQLRVDGDLKDTWPYDPLNVWGGTNAQYFGEVFHRGDDVFGTTNDKNDFNQSVIKDNNNWGSHSFTFNGDGRCM